MNQKPLRDRILELLGAPGARPLDKVEMGKALNVHSSERRKIGDTLAAMERSGEVARIRKDCYILPETADLLTGTVQVHRNGNAHLIGEKRGQSDVFIVAANLGTAMNGDKVVAQQVKGGRGQRGGRVEARVIRILERANSTIVGTLRKSKQFSYVVPDDPRLQHNFYVAPGDARVGDKVVVEFEGWESRESNPEGRITEVLGAEGAPGVDMLSVIRDYDLPTEFPEAVTGEAENIPETIHADEISRREDLRGSFIITIDPDDAKDFDDAIDVTRTANGWKLGVHIADVSHYVRPGSELDREARERGNSTYLVDRVLPMLPERLSNGICSLKPGVERLTFSTFLELDDRGKVRKARFARTVIRSAARLTYRQAFAILNNQPVPPTPNYERGGKVFLAAKPVPLDVTPELVERAKTAWELASLLRKNRFAAGSLDLDFPEVKVWLDDQGKALKLERVENDISHQLVEEFMLAANEAVGRELRNKSIPTVYRIHENPDEDRLADFREFAASYGFKAGDISKRPELQKLLVSTRGKAEEYAIKLALLKSLKRAVYSPEPIGHYGLAKANYTHFTSPIRRYADLIVHRSLGAVEGVDRGVQRPKTGVSSRDVGELAEHISRTERNSADAERDSVQIKKIEYFQRQLDSRKPDAFRAMVVDVRSFGLLIELPDVLVSGAIPVSVLPGDFYQFDSVRMRFVGRSTRRVFKIGDSFPVIVCAVDKQRRQMEFAPVDSTTKDAKGAKGRDDSRTNR